MRRVEHKHCKFKTALSPHLDRVEGNPAAGAAHVLLPGAGLRVGFTAI